MIFTEAGKIFGILLRGGFVFFVGLGILRPDAV